MPIIGVTASSILKITGSYESIATVTGNGVNTTLTFSSIPSTYKHLQIRGFYFDGGYNLNLRFNADSTSSYYVHNIAANGAGGSITGQGFAVNTSADLQSYGADSGNLRAACIIDIPNYTSTSKVKTLKYLSMYPGTSNQLVWAGSALWNKTDAISSITITDIYNAYSSASTFALYGIKGA